jgi:type I restriction enzyme R subunit
VYDFKRAIIDGATLPLRYLNRGEKLGIENPDLDERMAEIINETELDDDQRRKLEREFKRDYPILTSEQRLDAIAKDLVWHFNERGYQGKAMFVALDKPTAVRMYDLAMKYWPEYISELKQRIAKADYQQEELKLKHHLKRVEETEVCVVVSSEQNEVKKFAKLGLDIEKHRKKMVERDLETERAMREGLDEENLAIFDLLKKPELTKAEEATVKEVETDLGGVESRKAENRSLA